MSTSTIITHVIAIGVVFLAFAAIVASLFGTAWFKENLQTVTGNQKYEYGILRSCSTYNDNKCSFREDIFKFDYMNNGKKIMMDVLLSLFTCCLAFNLLAIIFILTLLCCRRNKTYWKVGTIGALLMSLFGALSCFGCLVYSETKTKDLNFSIGWSCILGWVGATLDFLAFILSTILLCVPPKGQNGGRVNIRPNSKQPVYVPRMYDGRNSYKNNGYARDEFMY